MSNTFYTVYWFLRKREEYYFLTSFETIQARNLSQKPDASSRSLCVCVCEEMRPRFQV